MFKRLLFVLLILPVHALAQNAEADRFFELLRLDEMVAVIREEGLVDNATMPEDMMLGQGGPAWEKALDRIYSPQSMLETLTDGVVRSIGSGDLGEINAYLETPTWQDAVDLELAARTAMLDPDVTEAAFQTYYDTFGRNSRRMKDLDELVETADLIEGNVVGALNAMLQFNLGLMSAGFEIGYTEDELLTQIWSEEDLFRKDVTEWVYAFLLLAYDPMERQMLRDQIAFFKTDEGQRLNRALMDGFDAMFDELSFKLGAAIGEMLEEQTL